MSFLSFLGLALKDSLFYKSRLIGSILGALIAVGFIAAAVISVDGISSGYFKDRLEERDYHLSYYRYEQPNSIYDIINVDEAEQKVLDVKGVEEARAYAYLSTYFSNKTIGEGLNICGVTPTTARYQYGSDTTLPMDGRGVIVTSGFASRLGLSVGDSFNLTVSDVWYSDKIIEDIGRPDFYDEYWGPNTPFALGFSVFAIKDHDSEREDDYFYYGTERAVMGLNGLRNLISRLEDEKPDQNLYANTDVNQRLTIKISPDHFDNIEDADLTRDQARKISRDIDRSISGLGYDLDNNVILDIYYDYQMWSWMMRIFFIVLSVPLLLISFYLLSAGSKVGMDERIREIGLLKIKGASRGQVVSILLLESLGYGIIGGGLGLFGGSIMSLFFTARIMGLEPFGDLFRGDLPVPGPGLFVLAFVVIPLVILLMRLSSTLKLSKVPLLEALGRATIIEKQKTYKIKWDLVILGLTGLIVGSMVYFNQNPPNNFYTSMYAFLLYFLSPLTILFLPFLLILSLSRLLILGFDFTLDLLANAGRLLVDDLFPVVKANMRFQRKRIATMTILVTTVMAFGIMVSSLDASRNDKVEKDVSATIPTDLMLIESQGEDLTEDIEMIEDVDWVVTTQEHLDMTITSYRYEYYGRVMSFDPSIYEKRIGEPDHVRVEGKGVKDLSRLSGPVPILINKAFRTDTGTDIGDELTLTYNGGERYDTIANRTDLECEVVGIISYLPGMRSTIEMYDLEDGSPYINVENRREEPAIYLDSSRINISMPAFRYYHIDVDGGKREVKTLIEGMETNSSGRVIIDKREQIDRIKEEPFFASIKMLLDMEYLFVITAVTAGVALFMIVSTASRRREFAEILARGSTRKHVLKLVLTEGIIVLVAALIIGTGIGVIVSIAFQNLFTFELFEIIEMILDPSSRRDFVDTGNGIVFPPSLIFLYTLAVLSVLGASLLTSYIASKVDVASSLRLRTS